MKVSGCRGVGSKGEVGHCLGISHRWGLVGSGPFLFLEKMLCPQGFFAGVEINWREELNYKVSGQNRGSGSPFSKCPDLGYILVVGLVRPAAGGMGGRERGHQGAL